MNTCFERLPQTPTPPEENRGHCAGGTVLILVSAEINHAEVGAIAGPLQLANKFAKTQVFEWKVSQWKSGYSRASVVEAASLPARTTAGGMVAIVGKSAFPFENSSAVGWLRWKLRQGTNIVLMDEAQFPAANAGLLQTRRIAVHWEKIGAFRDVFVDVDAVDQLYEVHRSLSSSTCPDATLEIILAFIKLRCGDVIENKVREQLNRRVIRRPDEPQRMPMSSRLGTRNSAFLRIVEFLEREAVEEVEMKEICRMFGVSQRQLERSFKKVLGVTPSNFVKNCRLEKAVQLLQLSDLSFTEVAIACGFHSQSTFSKAFKAKFGMTPSKYVAQGCRVCRY